MFLNGLIQLTDCRSNKEMSKLETFKISLTYTKDAAAVAISCTNLIFTGCHVYCEKFERNKPVPS